MPKRFHKRKRERIFEALKLVHGEVCSLCGYRTDRTDRTDGKEPNPLEVDHVDGNAKNNELWNLRLLCRRCNRKLGVQKGWASRRAKSEAPSLVSSPPVLGSEARRIFQVQKEAEKGLGASEIDGKASESSLSGSPQVPGGGGGLSVTQRERGAEDVYLSESSRVREGANDEDLGESDGSDVSDRSAGEFGRVGRVGPFGRNAGEEIERSSGGASLSASERGSRQPAGEAADQGPGPSRYAPLDRMGMEFDYRSESEIAGASVVMRSKFRAAAEMALTLQAEMGWGELLFSCCEIAGCVSTTGERYLKSMASVAGPFAEFRDTFGARMVRKR